MRLALILVVAVLAAPDRPDLTPKEARPQPPLKELIQGEWQVVTATANGVPNKIIAPGQASFRFEGNKMFLRRGKIANETAYEFVLDATKSPATFDFSIGKGAGQSLMGIIKLEGDTLTICYYFSRQPGRPTEFASTPTSQSALWQLKRAKK